MMGNQSDNTESRDGDQSLSGSQLDYLTLQARQKKHQIQIEKLRTCKAEMQNTYDKLINQAPILKLSGSDENEIRKKLAITAKLIKELTLAIGKVDKLYSQFALRLKEHPASPSGVQQLKETQRLVVVA